MVSFAWKMVSAPAPGDFSELGGGRLLGFSESDEEGVDARVAALPSDGFDFVLGLCEQPLGEIKAHVANLVAGCAADVLTKGLVQSAARHAGGTGDSIHADRVGE